MARRKANVSAGGDGAVRQPRQHSLVWLQGLLCGALATLATPTALLLGVLLGPALLAVTFDSEPGRPVGRSVALFSMAASVRPLKTLWLSGHTMQVAAGLVGDLQVVGTAWSAAAAGWLLAQILPIAVRTVLEALGLARSAQLKAERARLVSEWGLEDQAEVEP
ncbi:MAG TPA: hypothetical protein VL614_28845 [Acetobacteraceae bacterium]|jgi:hypothetical protein|nr:hypothetical protein [Acetobacteraceae bacterium]